MIEFDIIIGMNYLSAYYIVLNCNTKFVTLEISKREKLEWKGLYKPKQVKIISSIQASKISRAWMIGLFGSYEGC